MAVTRPSVTNSASFVKSFWFWAYVTPQARQKRKRVGMNRATIASAPGPAASEPSGRTAIFTGATFLVMRFESRKPVLPDLQPIFREPFFERQSDPTCRQGRDRGSPIDDRCCPRARRHRSPAVPPALPAPRRAAADRRRRTPVRTPDRRREREKSLLAVAGDVDLTLHGQESLTRLLQ